MTAQSARVITPLPSACFRDDEPVFGAGHHLLPGVPVPVFGDTGNWSGDCIGRRANFSRSDWKINFPSDDPLATLRLREVAFSLLNPTHVVLRQAAIYLPAEPTPFLTVMHQCQKLRIILRWARTQELPEDPGQWDQQDWHDLIAERSAVNGLKTVASYVNVVRRLRQLAPAVTGVSPFDDPWEGMTAAEVARQAVAEAPAADGDELATPSVPPQTWWPLLRAAWTYIHTFAPDILRWRENFEQVAEEVDRTTGPRRRVRVTADQADAEVAAWLADPKNVIPLHARPLHNASAGSPMWSTLSQLVTGGRSPFVFSFRPDIAKERIEARRAGVFEAIREGRTLEVGHDQVRQLKGTSTYRPSGYHRPRRLLDEDVRQWLADPANLIPVRAKDDELGQAGTPVLETLGRLVWGNARHGMRFGGTEAGRARLRVIEEAAAAGQRVEVGRSSWRSLPLDTPDAAEVTRADGTIGPWRTQITREELDEELRMVRAACYVFVAAMSMMRDSEVQEITRDSLATHYGSPALVSRKTKREPTRPERFWWIIEPVAEAIAVAEQLSWHPTHLFASIDPPSKAEGISRAGFNAAFAIDYFMDRVNAAADRLGLQEIPDAHVRSHMFRKTMSGIASREPDSEIALGLQLKHAARRALANRTTQAYGKMDTAWIKEFDQQLEYAAGLKLVGLLKARRDGEAVAVGPGAARLHAGLDKVIAVIDTDPQLRAQIADERLEASLLASEFPELHLGTLNHCLFDAPQAECQNELPEDQRGKAPLIGACQPDRCRNSVITKQHAPIWIAEEQDLTTMAKSVKIAPPRREAVLIRLADVKRITSAFKEDGGNL